MIWPSSVLYLSDLFCYKFSWGYLEDSFDKMLSKGLLLNNFYAKRFCILRTPVRLTFPSSIFVYLTQHVNLFDILLIYHSPKRDHCVISRTLSSNECVIATIWGWNVISINIIRSVIPRNLIEFNPWMTQRQYVNISIMFLVFLIVNNQIKMFLCKCYVLQYIVFSFQIGYTTCSLHKITNI